MSDLNNHYQSIMKDLESHIKNEEELKYVKDKFNELSMMFMDVIDRLTVLTDMRIKGIEKTQQEIEHRITKVQKEVDGIQSDIYEDDENYEFEIICPYCNYQFTTDIESELNTEIECPECHNMIELDWNSDEEDSCMHECTHCSSSCLEDNNEEYEIEELPENKQNEDEQDNSEEDEDM